MKSKRILRMATIMAALALAAVLPGGPVLGQMTPTQPNGNQGDRTTGDVTNNVFQRFDAEGGKTSTQGPVARRDNAKRSGPPKNTVTTIRAAEGGGGGGGGLIVGGKGAFSPVSNMPVDYTEVPDVGQPVTISSTTEGATRVLDILDLLSVSTSWNIVMTPSIEQKTVRFFAPGELRPKQVLELLKFAGVYYTYEPESGFLYVSSADEKRAQDYGEIVKTEFTVQYLDVNEAQATLQSLSSEGGRMIADPRTGRILVWDTQLNIDEMKTTLKKLDVPLEPRSYPLKYVNADTLVDSIQTVMSERGNAYADLRLNTLIVTDLPSRQEQISAMVAEMDRKLETRVWKINYLELDEVADRLSRLVPEEMGTITTDENVHQVSVEAIPERLDEIDGLIRAWDQKPRQVQIEAYLVSVSQDLSRDLGVNWTYFGNLNGQPFSIQHGQVPTGYLSGAAVDGQRFRIGEFPYAKPDYYPGTTTPRRDINGRAIIDEFGGNNLQVFLDYLDTQKDATILARPRVTVQDGEEASFENTEERPYQEGGYYGYGSGNTTTGVTAPIIGLQVKFLQVGTILRVKPSINDEDNITMDIKAESSTPTQSVVTVTGEIPGKQKSSSETAVMVHDGQTVVIGGLGLTTVDDSLDKVSMLGDVPILGNVFRNKKKDHKASELLIFIRPTIVDEMTMPEATSMRKVTHDTTALLREDRKPLSERLQTYLTGGKNEIAVSVTQEGTLFCEGRDVKLEELDGIFADAKKSGAKRVVIFVHHNAPEQPIQDVAAKAKAAGLDSKTDGLLPSLRADEPLLPAPAEGTVAQEDVTPPTESVGPVEAAPAPAAGS